MPLRKEPSPTILALSRLLVCAAGLLCGYFLIVGLFTGEVTILTRSGAHQFYWNSQPGYYLAAVTFHTFVVFGVVWLLVRSAQQRR